MKRFFAARPRPGVRLAGWMLAGGLLLAAPATAQFGPAQDLEPLATAAGARSVGAADLDGDGDGDVLAAAYFEDGLLWYENLDGAGRYGPRQFVALDLKYAVAVRAADLDGDGDADVLAAASPPEPTPGVFRDRVVWYENLGGGRFGPQQLISTATASVRAVEAADLDGDGDLDVLSASFFDGTIRWHENLGGGRFGPERGVTTGTPGANAVRAADLDGDGDLDALVSASRDNRTNQIAWLENLDGQGTFGPPQNLTTTLVGPNAVDAADFDGDGDLDALASASVFLNEIQAYVDRIVWFENTDGAGTFGPLQEIEIDFIIFIVSTVAAADLDGDGDPDVLAGARELSWFENTDGAGTFGPRKPVGVGGSNPAVFAADLDADGDLDVLSAGSFASDGVVAWHENTDGAGAFDAHATLALGNGLAWDVNAADFDGDGDFDVLSGGGGEVAWHENTDGPERFAVKRLVSTEVEVFEVLPADLDRSLHPPVFAPPAWPLRPRRTPPTSTIPPRRSRPVRSTFPPAAT